MISERDVVQHIRMLSSSERDPLGVMAATCVRFLKYRWAKEWLNETATREKWNAARLPLTRKSVLQAMTEFYPLAWAGANKADGTIAMVTIYTYQALCWLLGNALDAKFGRTLFHGYCHFGKPQLVRLTNRYLLGPWEEYDDNSWHDSDKEIVLTANEALAAWRLKHNTEGDTTHDEAQDH